MDLITYAYPQFSIVVLDDSQRFIGVNVMNDCSPLVALGPVIWLDSHTRIFASDKIRCYKIIVTEIEQVSYRITALAKFVIACYSS